MTFAITIIEEAFESSSRELLESYLKKPIRVTEPIRTASKSLAAFVDFDTPSFHGALCLQGDTTDVRRLANDPDVHEEDWLAELCNQLVGRFKNKLTLYGHAPHVRFPVTCQKAPFSFKPHRDNVVNFHCSWPQGSFDVGLSLEVDSNLRFRCGNHSAAALEGSICIF